MNALNNTIFDISSGDMAMATNFHSLRKQYMDAQGEYKAFRSRMMCEVLARLAMNHTMASAQEISDAVNSTISPNEISALMRNYMRSFVYFGGQTYVITREKKLVPHYFIECDQYGNVIPNGKRIQQGHFHYVYGAKLAE